MIAASFSASAAATDDSQRSRGAAAGSTDRPTNRGRPAGRTDSLRPAAVGTAGDGSIDDSGDGGGGAGVAVAALHMAAFGIDPLAHKGMDGIDTFQQDRVARVVDEADAHLNAMMDSLRRIGDRHINDRMAEFQRSVRKLIRTVEEDPRDLTGARKYLTVYLQGARDATIKFADVYARTKDSKARSDFESLLDDLEKNFAARTRKMLLDDRSDLTVEIDVLRDRLQREGVRIEREME